MEKGGGSECRFPTHIQTFLTTDAHAAHAPRSMITPIIDAGSGFRCAVYFSMHLYDSLIRIGLVIDRVGPQEAYIFAEGILFTFDVLVEHLIGLRFT